MQPRPAATTSSGSSSAAVIDAKLFNIRPAAGLENFPLCAAETSGHGSSGGVAQAKSAMRSLGISLSGSRSVFLVFLHSAGVINFADCGRLRRFEPQMIELLGHPQGGHRIDVWIGTNFRNSPSGSHLTIDPKGVRPIVVARFFATDAWSKKPEVTSHLIRNLLLLFLILKVPCT